MSEDRNSGLAGVPNKRAEERPVEEALYLSEAVFSGILSIAIDAIISVDASHRIILFNEGAEQIFGYSKEEALGQPLDMLIPKKFRNAHAGHIQDFAASPSVARRMGERQEIFGLRKTGEEFPADASISQFEVGGQRIFTVVLRDITERKQIENALRQAHDELERRVEERTAELARANEALQAEIAERKLAEGALRESEQRYRVVAETASDAIITIDESSAILFVNRAAERIFGYTTDEMLGRQLTMLMPQYLRHVHEAGLKRYLETGERHISWERVELPGLHQSGKEIPLEISFGEFIRDGRRVFTGIVRDITERRRAQAERDQLLILEQAARARAEKVADILRGLQNVTEAALSHFSLDELLDELLGRIRALLSADTVTVLLLSADGQWLVPRAAKGLEEEVESGIRIPVGKGFAGQVAAERRPVIFEDVDHMEIFNPLLREKGVKSLLGVPLLIEGRVIGVLHVGTFHHRLFSSDDVRLLQLVADRTALAIDHASLYEAERRARAEAETANRTKDEFLATISHELRTPLTAILGWANMLQSNMLDEAGAQRAVDAIARNSQSQAQIIDDLLDVSRIISGKLRLTTGSVDLLPVIYAAVDAVRPAADARGIRIQTALDHAAGLVSGDADRLQQVMWNLLANAIKFTSRGGQVRVELERINSHLEIAVSDTGQGIRADFLPYVFDRFRQADSSISRKHTGLGLGLAIVRHLVELHGGSVTAESAGVGQGATFTVKLPVRAVRAEPADAGPVHSRLGAAQTFGSRPLLAGLKALVVDDEPDARELICTVLTMAGGEVRTASSTAAALGELAEWKPDLLVSDIGMPVEDGYVLIEKVRKLAPEQGGKIPAVALTAYARVEDRMRALSAGYQMHVPKPIEPSELVTVVASLAGRD